MDYSVRMSSVTLSPHQWSRMLEFLRDEPNLYIGAEADCKRFIEAIVWMSRSGRAMEDASGRIREVEQRL